MSNWKHPDSYKLASETEVSQLVADERIAHVADGLEFIADDLFELNHPDKLDDDVARQSFVSEVVAQGAEFGRWFHFPWSSTLVRFPEADDHYALRTFRNQNLIKKEDQLDLQDKKIAVFGLSVGSNIVESTVVSGIGNEYLLFDFDRLSPTNLNRIRANMSQVGLYKTEIAGRKMAELDPYIAQQHFTNGYDLASNQLLRIERPDMIIEEVDNLEVKAELRRIAGELGIPLVMAGDVGDKVTLDIERHDLGFVRPFNGKLSMKEVNALLNGTLSDKARESALIKILGFKNLSPSLIDSAMRKGRELAGFPQLGTTAGAAGSLATIAVRDVLLGRKVRSASRVNDLRKVVGSSAPTTLKENTDIIRRFVTYRKRQGVTVEEAVAEVESISEFVLPDIFEIPRASAEYHIKAGYLNTDPKLALKAQQIHGRSYVDAGYFTEDALAEDGSLVPDLDSTREKDGMSLTISYLLASKDDTIENAGASLRLVDVAEGGSVYDLPSLRYFKDNNSLNAEAQKHIQKFVEEYGEGSIRDIVALAMLGDTNTAGSYELMRSVTQNAIIKYHLDGTRQLYVAALSQKSLRPVAHLVGPAAIEILGQAAEPYTDEPRARKITLTPVLLDPLKILEGNLDAIEASKTPGTTKLLIRNLTFLADGLTREQMGERVADYLDQLKVAPALSA